MKFGDVPTAAAIGGMLAHSTKVAEHSLPKGKSLGPEEIKQLLEAGIDTLTVALLEEGDVAEDQAASALAMATLIRNVRFSAASTGRVNFHAKENGIFVPDQEAIDLFNRSDPAITIATLKVGETVNSGDLVATIKIIPLAVPRTAIEAIISSLGTRVVLDVSPFMKHDVALISTRLPALKQSVVDKTRRNLSRRLENSRSTIAYETSSDHQARDLASKLREAVGARGLEPQIIVIFGASAVIDECDVIPEAIRLEGGRVIRVGMPVDPGNLLVLGELQGVPVIGAPGCARSPRENGFDWVLNRLLIGERPDTIDIAGMGVGGLLREISSRPSPRESAEQTAQDNSVAAILLAAGTSSRMGEPERHKLLARFDGLPLVRRSALAALDSRASNVFAVTGHRRAEIEHALEGLPVMLCQNDSYADGIASSIVRGLKSASEHRPLGVLVLLADMPNVTSEDINLLIRAFIEAKGSAVVRAITHGKRGNPVIIPKCLFPEALKLQGDVGAKHLIANSGLDIIDVEIGDAAYLDVDTPDALAAAGGTFE